MAVTARIVAQLATGEGKSIVIAMCAIVMVKLFDMKVHIYAPSHLRTSHRAYLPTRFATTYFLLTRPRLSSA